MRCGATGDEITHLKVFYLFIAGIKGDKTIHQFYLFLDEFHVFMSFGNVPQYPGYAGCQHLTILIAQSGHSSFPSVSKLNRVKSEGGVESYFVW